MEQESEYIHHCRDCFFFLLFLFPILFLFRPSPAVSPSRATERGQILAWSLSFLYRRKSLATSWRVAQPHALMQRYCTASSVPRPHVPLAEQTSRSPCPYKIIRFTALTVPSSTIKYRLLITSFFKSFLFIKKKK